MMNNLEKLTADIRSRIPRLMGLTEGCLLERKGLHKIVFLDKEEALFFIFSIEHFYSDWKSLKDINSNYKIIGAEPMLNDVLEWLQIIDWTLAICSNGVLIEEQVQNEYYTVHTELNLEPKWDLSKPLLKDQSQNLIDYLVTLIK